ncbi:MAG: ThuA domain-containing protein [Candidatus Omnitrophota bacterium]
MKLRIVVTALCFLMAAAPSFAAEKPIRVLYLTKSSGFEHSVIHREKGELGLSEKVMLDLAEKNNFALVVTKDAGMINEQQLKCFDVVQWYTTGDLCQPSKDGGAAMSEAGRDAFVKWVKDGGGFAGMHTAADTFQSGGKSIYEPYREIAGGVFLTHKNQEEAKLLVQKHPITSHLDPEWTILDEWYIFTDVTKTLKPLIVLDTKSMKQDEYKQRDPYPIAWLDEIGQGRVFCTAMGHREDVWTNPKFQELIVKGIKWAAKRLD